MVQRDITIFPYLQSLFEDPEFPLPKTASNDVLEGSFQRFGFPFLQTMLEMGEETGSLQIRDQDGQIVAELTLENGFIVESQHYLNPFDTQESLLELLNSVTPGPYRFQFVQKELEPFFADIL